LRARASKRATRPSFGNGLNFPVSLAHSDRFSPAALMRVPPANALALVVLLGTTIASIANWLPHIQPYRARMTAAAAMVDGAAGWFPGIHTA